LPDDTAAGVRSDRGAQLSTSSDFFHFRRQVADGRDLSMILPINGYKVACLASDENVILNAVVYYNDTYNAMHFHLMHNTIQYNAMQCNAMIQCNTMQCNAHIFSFFFLFHSSLILGWMHSCPEPVPVER
jgi:hypothetical protein